MTVQCGIDNNPELNEQLKGLRIGVITNHTALDASRTPTAAALMKRSGARVTRLFAPEHGLTGEVPDQESIHETTDPVTGLPVLSLYGASEAPSAADLSDLDALVFDIQDIGSRYYTFNWTMVKCMEAAARTDTMFVVLDRPNPLTGTRVQGNVSDAQFSSLVGLYPCATRHGMTPGEIALYVNGEFNIGADLSVVKMRGWRRSMWFDETGLTFIPPSPNTTGLSMATVYPGTCLFEGTNMSEGRGTTLPFELIGAPGIDPVDFAGELNGRNLEGVWFRPTYFIPVTSKGAGLRCGGVGIHVLDRHALDAFRLGLEMLFAARTVYPNFQWRHDPRGYSIDLLAGTDALRLAMDGGATVEEMMDMWADDLDAFIERRREYLLYPL